MPGDATILDHAQTCMVLFDDLLSTINGKSRPDPDAELSAQADDQAGRFSIWAGNIGVFATVNASLDYRVRDTPQIKGLIIPQLGGLAKFLQRTIGIAQHETWHAIPQVAGTAETEEDAGSSISSAPDSSSMSDSVESESASFTRSPLKEGIKDVEKTISRLYRLSTTIRKSAVQNRKTKAANYVDRDESGHDMSSEFEKYATHLVKQEYPDMSQVLCERLGYANSLRRRQFLYRQRHQQKLSLGTKSRVSQGGTELMPEPSVLTPGTRDGAHSLSKDLQFGHSPAVREDGKSALLSQTMAPALEIRSIRPGGALSMVSTAITASPVQGSFDVPSPPQLTARAKEFQCPYCCLMLPAKEASPSRWRHHVKKDLEPYVCMFEECAEPHKLFSTTADWLAHMQWEHTLQWRCNARGHPPQVFDREQDFENHMRSSHAGTFSESQLPVLKRRGAQPTPETFFSCPLCGYIPSECPEELNNGKQSEDLLNHVAAHLQDIALVSLPWRGDLEGIASSNTTSAPKARDSILDLQDERSVSSFEDTPHEFTDDIESIDEDRVSTLDREFREHEGSSAPIQGLVKLTEETANYIRNTVRKSEMRKKLLEEFEFIGETLVFLKRRPEAAQPEDAFLQKFVKTANPDKGLSADGTILLIEIFAQLRRCLANIQDEITTKPSNKKLLGERARHSDGNQAEMLLDNLSRISVHIKQILSQDHPTLNSSGVEASLRNQKETYSGQLSESLSPLDFTARQEHIFRDSFGNGGWFLETQEFKAWVSGRPWTLFVYGNPGVGKTVLSSIVVHHLQEMSKTENILILCMYVDYNDTGKQTLENLFGSLVRQLVQYYPSISLSTDMAKPMKKIGKEFGRLKLKDIISVLDSEIQKFPRVYLIVDALDECEVTIRNELELQIKDLQSSRLSVMITSRYLGIPSAVHVDCDVCGKEDLRLFYHCGITPFSDTPT